MNTCEYLDAVKARHGIVSDYRLSKVLGLTQPAISNYRRGAGMMDVTTAAKVAELLNLSPLQVIADLETQRAKKPETRRFWARYAAAVIVGLAGLAGAGTPEPAGAVLHNPINGHSNAPKSLSLYTLCDKGRRRKARRGAFSQMAAALMGAREPSPGAMAL